MKSWECTFETTKSWEWPGDEANVTYMFEVSCHYSLLQVVEKELLIQEREKLYMELKQILQRQPGPEVAEQLQIYQQTLKEKTKQMKVYLHLPLQLIHG